MDPPHRLSTPFNDKLGTNYTPSFEEVTLIKSFLREPLDTLNAHVLQTQSVLQELLAKQSRLKAGIGAYHILCHPIRRLSDELLVEIFSHTLPIDRLPIMDPSEPPIVLTHICQRWRSLALSTPALWTSVHIPVPAKSSERDYKHAEITKARAACLEWWLGNSAKQPLTISLYWPQEGDTPYYDGTEYLHGIPLVICDHFYHISDLTLDVPDRVLGAFFPKVSPHELTTFEKVSFHNRGLTDNYYAPGRVNIWRAPTLKKIFWARSCIASIVRMPGLQWDKLHEVSVMNGIDPDVALKIATAAPNLVKLSVVLVPGASQHGFHGELGGRTRSTIVVHLVMNFVVLPHLTMLYVAEGFCRDKFGGFARMFLEYLQLPSLRNLTYQLSGMCPTEVGDAHPLLRFLRSQAHDQLPLTSLKISSAISRTILIDCLARIPKLEHLWLGDGPELWLRSFEALAAFENVIWDDRLVIALSPPISSKNSDRTGLLCPRLQSFRVDKARFTFQQMRELVRGRLPTQRGLEGETTSPLRHLSVGLDYVDPHGFTPKVFEELCQFGAKVRVTFEKAREPEHIEGHRPRDGLKIEAEGEDALWAC